MRNDGRKILISQFLFHCPTYEDLLKRLPLLHIVALMKMRVQATLGETLMMLMGTVEIFFPALLYSCIPWDLLSE